MSSIEMGIFTNIGYPEIEKLFEQEKATAFFPDASMSQAERNLEVVSHVLNHIFARIINSKVITGREINTSQEEIERIIVFIVSKFVLDDRIPIRVVAKAILLSAINEARNVVHYFLNGITNPLTHSNLTTGELHTIILRLTNTQHEEHLHKDDAIILSEADDCFMREENVAAIKQAAKILARKYLYLINTAERLKEL